MTVPPPVITANRVWSALATACHDRTGCYRPAPSGVGGLGPRARGRPSARPGTPRPSPSATRPWRPPATTEPDATGRHLPAWAGWGRGRAGDHRVPPTRAARTEIPEARHPTRRSEETRRRSGGRVAKARGRRDINAVDQVPPTRAARTEIPEARHPTRRSEETRRRSGGRVASARQRARGGARGPAA